ncbi:unnamed protein product [Camellia sinensis]
MFLELVLHSVNADLYKVLVKELAQTLERQFVGNAESRAAGMVINTMEWIEGVGYELLLHAIDAFNAIVVLVLGQECKSSSKGQELQNKVIGGGPQAPRSALPIGVEPAADPTRLVLVNINRDLLHLVLAISFAKEPDQIISSNEENYIPCTIGWGTPEQILDHGNFYMA